MTARLTSEATSVVDALAAEQAADDHPPERRRALEHPGPRKDRVLTYSEHKDMRDARDNPNKRELETWLKAEAKRALEQRPMMRRWDR